MENRTSKSNLSENDPQKSRQKRKWFVLELMGMNI